MECFKVSVMKSYLNHFFSLHKFPDEASRTLTNMFDIIMGSENKDKYFVRFVEDFWNDKDTDYDKVFEDLSVFATSISIHPYSIHLLFLLCLCPHTRELYKKDRLDESVFNDSMEDFRIAMMECYEVYEVWGTHYGRWQLAFCKMQVIAFGRLQFGTSRFGCDYHKNHFHVRENDLVIVTHIPSGGPLFRSSCLESYARAEKYYRKKYRKEFSNKPMPFVGYSWMLYPPIKDILVENSNLIRFVNDYDIYHCDTQNMDEDLWRVFGKEYKKPPEELPQNTRLQRNMVNWLLEGNHLGRGDGILFIKRGRFSV